MKAIKKARGVLILLTLVIIVAATPVTSFASESPNLIPRIYIHFAMGVTVTLTDVHEYFLDFGNHSMGVWMSPTETIAFNFAGEPSCPVLGTLYEGVPFAFQDIVSRTESSEGWIDYITFFLVQTPIQGELALSVDADYLVNAGLDDWFVFNINGFLSFEDFSEQLQVRGRHLREREVFPPPLLLYDVTSLIDTSFPALPSTDETESGVFSDIIIIAAISFLFGVLVAILGMMMLKRSKKKNDVS